MKEGGKGVVYETDKRGNGVARKRGEEEGIWRTGGGEWRGET